MTRRAATVAAAAVLVVAGCQSTVDGQGAAAPLSPRGSSHSRSAVDASNANLSPYALAAATRHAFTSAQAFRMVGAINAESTGARVDMHYGATSSSGTLTILSTPVQLRYVAPDLWVNASVQFWTATGSSLGVPAGTSVYRLAGHWVHIPAADASDILDFVDRKRVVDSFGELNKQTQRGPSTTLDGVPVVSFIDGEDGTVYVPVKGPADPARIVSRDTSAGGTVDFSDWNVPYAAPRPPTGQVVELPN